jgi:DNA-binding CsgD family transcriptional regulator
MRAKDVKECVTIISTHAVMRSHYADALSDLAAVWLGLLGREAFRAVVFEDSQKSCPNIVGFGVSAFVSDDFLHSLKRPPFFWLGPELTKRISRGEYPLLSDRAVREANAKGGLNLVVWEAAVRAEFWERVETHTTAISAFVELHRGFLLKEVISQTNIRKQLESSLRSGAQLLQEDGRYVDSVDISPDLDKLLKIPHYIGLTRKVALSRPGAWVGSLFIYQAPHCGFRPSEQRLLLAALPGLTDQELADDLGISLSAVKKTWLSIYNRVSSNLPSLFPDRVAMQGESERGREKKQHLISYLRDHPEELRPASPLRKPSR